MAVKRNYPEGFVFGRFRGRGEGKHFKRWSEATAQGGKTPCRRVWTFIGAINEERALIGPVLSLTTGPANRERLASKATIANGERLCRN